MSACNCKSLVRASLSSLRRRSRPKHSSISLPNLHQLSPNLSFLSLASRIHQANSKLSLLHLCPKAASSLSHSSINGALSGDTVDDLVEASSTETPDESSKDTVEDLLLNANDDVGRFMKMERRSEINSGGEAADKRSRWFPYLDLFKYGGLSLSSREVIESMDPYILEIRKERIRNAVKNRSYSVCLVVEGLSDFGNVSAAFRSADALGIQSVHVVSYSGKKRYRDNRHVSMGAEKWLDIELWESTRECFNVLKSRGYRIATTHLGTDAVSVYDMDWSFPTAIVVGNENRGISDEALELSDLHCSIPMKGMVDSFNVSVAAGILMHHAVCDRISRMGSHGDLIHAESQILLAEFSLRHSKSAVSVAHEYAKRKVDMPISKL